MAKCDTCGNDYKNSFQVIMGGKTHTFDCFECAVEMLAPACAHCGCSIIGHGVEQEGELYCCSHCSRQMSQASTTSTSTSVAPPIDEQESVITDPRADKR